LEGGVSGQSAGWSDLEAVLAKPIAERVVPLTRLGRLAQGGAGDRTAVAAALAQIVTSGAGSTEERMEVGELLAELGDPRLHTPDQADYWASLTTEDGTFEIGRQPVTNAEWKVFVAEGAYERPEWWSAEGWAFVSSLTDPWPKKAAMADAAAFVIDNQPVVGVSWHEAKAYAARHGARLPLFDERLFATRGPAKRPYPWGSPFGKGNANTREEVLGRPCAVGLFVNDRTPEGIVDLAGNVAEWTEDGAGDERWLHPGCWADSFESSWAKARVLVRPTHRSARLGFRLARGGYGA
jgi:hypothetical protein